MSGIWGVFNRDGAPAPLAELNNMRAAMSPIGSDGCRGWHDGSMGVGCALLWNTPESKRDDQPRVQGMRGQVYVVVSDARLDNRSELADLLGPWNSTPVEHLADTELILAAYRRWGERCPEHLLGDFVFVIWDEARQSLFCVRDHVGIKSLYFHLSSTRMVFANDIRGVVAHSEVPREFNDQAVALYLVQAGLHHPTWTFFRKVRKLPPGTSLFVTAGRVNQRTYWRPDDSPHVRLKSLGEYTEKLRYLLEDAVRVRVRSDYPIATHLSGGLDSTSIAVLAARMLRQKGRGLTGFNWVHAPGPDDDPDYYEWGNSRRLAALERIDHRHIEIDADALLGIFSTHDIAWNDTADLWYEHLLRRQAHRQGVRVILSGWGGDEFASYHGGACFGGLFWRGRVLAALRGIYREARLSPRVWRRAAGLCYAKLLLPLSPLRRRVGMTGAHWLHPEFRALLHPGIAGQAVEASQQSLTFPRLGGRADQLTMHRMGYVVSRIESWAVSGAREQVEYRYPLLDKRLIEFSLGVPAEFHRQQGYGRFLFRRAVSDILPSEIAWGVSKWEPKRVDRNVRLAFEAYAGWADLCEQTFEHGKTAPPSRYIDIARLRRLIADLASWQLLAEDEQIDLADGVGLALLAATLGRQIGLSST